MSDGWAWMAVGAVAVTAIWLLFLTDWSSWKRDRTPTVREFEEALGRAVERARRL